MAANRLLGAIAISLPRNFCRRRLLTDVLQNKECGRRSQCSTAESLWEMYKARKLSCDEEHMVCDVNPSSVFANNELHLSHVDIYGFDYDYTIACYQESLHYLIFNLGKEVLINKFKYPVAINDFEFKPGFAIRGLHYDILKGLLMKLDAFHQIQFGSVFRGLTPVSDDEVISIYGQLYLPKEYVEGPYFTGKNASMQQLNDLFSIPEIGLLVNVQEYFEKNNIPYQPEILFWDVKNAVQSIHPVMHKIVEEHTEDYLIENGDLKIFFERLIKGNKKLFLVTNSPYSFVNKGLSFLIGPKWQEIFDLIIVKARKPSFFHNSSRPFRIYDTLLHSQTWEKVSVLEKGKIYLEGSLKDLQSMTDWKGRRVLYFGDHVYSDLADLTLHYGWGTGAIISELAYEINIQNKPDFKKVVRWLEELQLLIEEKQDNKDSESMKVIKQWEEERDSLRHTTKKYFNAQFGSLFRTHHNPTYFSRRLFRFADIYMSSLTNLLNYSLKHSFYPRRGILPHELAAR